MRHFSEDIRLAICTEVDTSDLLSLSLVSHQWKRAAQTVLFSEARLFEEVDGGGVVSMTPIAAFIEQMHWFHQSVTTSPHLGAHIRLIAYQYIQGQDIFDKFSQIIHVANSLQELHLCIRALSVVQLDDAQRYRNLFEAVNFEALVIFAQSLDCIMFVPARRLRLLNLIALEGGDLMTNTQVDFANYSIIAHEVEVRGFNEEHRLGLGSSFWYTTSFLAFCLHDVKRFELSLSAISAKRLHRLLRAIGGQLEDLCLYTPLARSSNASESLAYIDTFQWSSLLPKVEHLELDFISESMAGIKTLRYLTILYRSTLDHSRDFILRSLFRVLAGEFAPALTSIVFDTDGDLLKIVPIPSMSSAADISKICHAHRSYIYGLAAIFNQRQLAISPPGILQSLLQIVEARLLLYGDTTHTRGTQRFKVDPSDRDGMGGALSPHPAALEEDDDNIDN